MSDIENAKGIAKTVSRRPPGAAMRARVGETVSRNGLTLFFALMAVGVAVGNPSFLEPSNLVNVIRSASVIGIIACGMTVVMIGGGFDLSVARTAALAGVVMVLLQDFGPAVAIGGALASATVVGLINGVLIVRARVNPFVVTLGMMSVVGSASLLISGGRFLDRTANWVPLLGQGDIAGVPRAAIWWLGAAVICHVLLRYMKPGRWIYASGGNVEAARLTGIATGRVIGATYLLVAFFAGVAGIVLAGRLNSASGISLPSGELDAIAAVIIGGTRLNGGSGSIPGTVVGVLILATLKNGVVLLGVDPYWQGVLVGVAVIAAVAFNIFQMSRRRV